MSAGLPSIAETIGIDAPPASDYQMLLDLRERIDTYLERAADVWFDRWKAADSRNRRNYEGSTVIEYDADTVTVQYATDASAAYEFDYTTVQIPIGDLLPEFARLHALMTALTSKGP